MIDYQLLFKSLGIDKYITDEGLTVFTPIDGSQIATVHQTEIEQMPEIINKASIAFNQWRNVPAPKRGELVRLLGNELRVAKNDLGQLVSLEMGKILTEGLGEVQEMIDICDLAVGQSRQLYGLTIASERPGHRMAESWLPLGVTGVITAFNFPVAVWAWNATLALVCGNSLIWKPSEKTPLTAIACKVIFERALTRFEAAPENLLQLVIGDHEIGEKLVESKSVALISTTGSTRMGKIVAPKVAKRFGRCLLELGGNNGMVVTPSADLELAVRAITFSAIGTSGQRCTSLRRLIVHESIADKLLPRLIQAYKSAPVGNPLTDGILVGPLIDHLAVENMQFALLTAKKQGGIIKGGELITENVPGGGFYVSPALVEMPSQSAIVRQETFAPILYVLRYESLEQAIELHNDVPQGLSSCIFTNDVREAETFLSVTGSDCGIANVNIGPSGAEIGGAFGGEKETGGGRESGSDAWKSYMRRQTSTVNYSAQLPLAQGVKFDF
ncbi:MAG: aldehyde dehydrogenase family protein [Gammaproteobacteria bacterium]|nr:aldehyde dehydrogenase family protein [Gammaproteobacteria bacterium]